MTRSGGAMGGAVAAGHARTASPGVDSAYKVMAQLRRVDASLATVGETIATLEGQRAELLNEQKPHDRKLLKLRNDIEQLRDLNPALKLTPAQRTDNIAALKGRIAETQARFDQVQVKLNAVEAQLAPVLRERAALTEERKSWANQIFLPQR